MQRTLGEFARACGGRLEGVDRSFSSISTDTRSLTAGELFIALRGVNFDGNAFATAAAERGAAGVVVSQQQNVGVSQIVVSDTQAALERAAQNWRNRVTIPVVGVAGSNGKTTVKEMIASIFIQQAPCLATRGNLNNHIGVPLTLLRLETSHRFAVVEMGANQPGDVAALLTLARPSIGVVTNAGAEHLAGFGSLEGVARAEGEMFVGLDASATAVINADDEFATLWRESTAATPLTFGLQQSADFSARHIETVSSSSGISSRFEMLAPQGSALIQLQLAGEHNVRNALAAAAATSAAGVSLQNIAKGLGAMQAVKGRLQFKTAGNGLRIIDDSYNANPSSMQAGIDVLASQQGRLWLVFGEMAELGEFTTNAHREVGTYAQRKGIERLYTLGEPAALAASTFNNVARSFSDIDSLIAALKADIAQEGSVNAICVLIKGSRCNRLERAVDALLIQE
jgi:UDP-N-acetylmuramoyl-tripeptide--D-alanyl-D-alanine ligase